MNRPANRPEMKPVSQNRPVAAAPRSAPAAPITNWRQQQAFGAKPRKQRSNPFAAVPLWGWGAVGGGVLIAVVVAVLAISHLTRVGGALSRTARMEAENRRTIDEIDRTVADFERQQEQSLFSDAPPDAMGADFDRFVSTMESKTARLTGTEGTIARSSISMLKKIQPEVRAFNAATAKVEAAPGADPSVINSRTDIEVTRKAFAELRTATQRLSAAIKGVPAAFRADLELQGVPPDLVVEAERGFNQGVNLDAAARVHNATIGMCDVSIKLLHLLKREWGSWTFHHAENAISFESVVAEREFKRIMQEMEQKMMQMAILEPGLGRPAGGSRRP